MTRWKKTFIAVYLTVIVGTASLAMFVPMKIKYIPYNDTRDVFVIQNIRMVQDYRKNVSFFLDFAKNGVEMSRWFPDSKNLESFIEILEHSGNTTWEE